MLKLFAFLFHGCWHDYKVYRLEFGGDGGEVVGFWTQSSCSKCGREKYKQHV